MLKPDIPSKYFQLGPNKLLSKSAQGFSKSHQISKAKVDISFVEDAMDLDPEKMNIKTKIKPPTSNSSQIGGKNNTGPRPF